MTKHTPSKIESYATRITFANGRTWDPQLGAEFSAEVHAQQYAEIFPDLREITLTPCYVNHRGEVYGDERQAQTFRFPA